jgi:hypothetical protein
MYFETLDDPGLMETARKIVAELGSTTSSTSSSSGEHVIEINPRISTIVYQEDLNLPYLGREARARGRSRRRSSARSLRGSGRRVAPFVTSTRSNGTSGHTVSTPSRAPTHPREDRARYRPSRRPFARRHAGSVTIPEQSLRVTHCPVNTAGVPWQNVLAQRARGLDARLVVFERYKLHPEADVSLDRHGGFLRRQLTQWRAFGRLAPRTDVFHFYFGLTLVPKSLQFPLLRALGKRSVMHFLGSDIRGKRPHRARVGGEGRRPDRGLVRRDPLGARGRRDPAGNRPGRLHAGPAHRS